MCVGHTVQWWLYAHFQHSLGPKARLSSMRRDRKTAMAISHPIILRYVASCSRIFKVSQQIFHVCWQVSCGLPTAELLSHSVQSWRHGSHRTAKNERSPPLNCLCMTYRSAEGGECLCSTPGPSQGKAEPVLTRKGQEARMPDSLA